MDTNNTPEIIEDAVYQIRTGNGLIRRYVRAVKVYGDKPLVSCEIYKDKNTDKIGTLIDVDSAYLVTPDQYPKYMFNPNKWLSKVTQTKQEKEAEISAALDSALQIGVETTAGSIQDAEYVKTLVETIKTLLTPVFGAFTLAMFIGFVKTKIKSAIEAQKPSEPKKKSLRERTRELKLLWKRNPAPVKTAEEVTKQAKKSLYTNKQETP